MKTLLMLSAALALFVAGVLAGPRLLELLYRETAVATEPDARTERKPIKYRHPMNPTIFSDAPAKDDMGMDYIPVYADDGGSGDDADLVKISPTLVNNLGVRTAPVERGELARRIDTVGYLDWDERRISHVHVRTAGWIERLQVRALGERVAKGELLFEFYSPELVNAQQEYLLALRTDRGALSASARDRLLALGLAESQIRALEQNRRVRQYAAVHARQDGVVSRLDVREGMYLRPDTEIMALADLSSVWVLVDVFEQQAGWVEVGQKAEVQIPYLPGEVWDGEVEYIYPDLDPKTRTLKVRLRFPNPGERLKPNMFTNVTLYADPKLGLSVPREALILDGDGARVLVQRQPGQFEAVPVEPGMESGDRVEIRSGLAEGDAVVVSAQFLIDSEASLKASIRRMSEAEDLAASAVEPALWGEGVVNAVRPAEGKVNLDHDPIEALGWPSMTMDFSLDETVDPAALRPGQRIRFELRQGDAGYVITAVDPQD